MGKLLILSWGVYPSKGGSTFLINNIAESSNPEHLVIVGQKPKTEPIKKWEENSKIKLYYLDPFPFGIKKFDRVLPWVKVGKLIKKVQQIVVNENVDRILTIFPNEYYCYIGMKVSEITGVPFSLWFHNSYVENRTGIWKRIALWLQPQLFKKAKTTFVMSKGMQSELNKIYPQHKFEVLVHGLNIDSKLFKVEAPRNVAERVKFLYTGTLNEACLDASLRLFEVITSNPKYDLYISTGNTNAFTSRGVTGDNVIFTPFLPMDEFLADLKNYDIMLLPHGFKGAFSDFEYRTIFPTRTIPLLFAGVPILAHSPKGSFLNEFLEQNDCSVLIDEARKDLLEEGIKSILTNSDLVARITTNARQTAEQFKVENIISKINELV